jgi:hypothetical protein
MRQWTVLLNLVLFALACSSQSKTVLVCEGTSSYAYHDHYCDGLNRCRGKIERVSLETALSMHRKPCHYCYKNQTQAPSAVETSQPPASRSLKSSAEMDSQCRAITKKGTRCSRRARSNGYCWQHGG